MDESAVTVIRGGQSVEGNTTDRYESWPVPGTERARLSFGAGGETAGSLGTGDPGTGARTGTETFADDPSMLARDLATAAESPHRLRYETPRLDAPVHVSGRVVPSLTVSFEEPTVVSGALVEYTGDGADVVTRGWADPLNRPRYDEYETPLSYRQSIRESAPLDGGGVRVEFPLQATDHVFESGSRLGVVVYASDKAFTLHTPGNREVTLSLGDSSVGLPVVGGESAVDEAVGE